MSVHSKSDHQLIAVMLLATVVAFCCAGTPAAAQDQPPPRWELFGGYSFFYPGANLNALNPGAITPLHVRLESNPRGAGAAITYNFTKWFGLTADFSGHWGSGESGLEAYDDAGFYNASFGPKLTFRRAHFAPFVEAMVGWHRLDSDVFGSDDRVGFIGGGGIDVPITRHFGLRLLQGDWVASNQHYGPSSVVSRTEVRGVRLQSGVTFAWGSLGSPAPVAATCAVSKSEVMVGEPLTATVTPTNFNPKHKLTYSWTASGGRTSGNDATTTIDTNGVAGGSYNIAARVSDPKVKHGQEALCTANFMVNEPPKNPPIMSCSADPASVQAGTPSTISCNCTSPDNIPVTVGSWTASSGNISGTGTTATLSTNEVAPGSINVTATCSDSRGLNTPASTMVNVENPPTPSRPTASKLSECEFPNPAKPWRVDNTCKAILDDVAQRLQHEADSRVVIVGNADPGEKRKNLAGTRAADAKAYLSGGEAKQAIDASRIEVRTGNEGTKTAQFWIVPAGATFDESTTTAVDESRVKAIPDHPHVRARKAPKADQ